MSSGRALAEVFVLKGEKFNASVTSNTNIFSNDLTTDVDFAVWRIYVAFSQAGALMVKRTRGTTTVSEVLNGGTNLVANAAYTFEIPVKSGDSINLQYSTSATANVLMVYEYKR